MTTYQVSIILFNKDTNFFSVTSGSYKKLSQALHPKYFFLIKTPLALKQIRRFVWVKVHINKVNILKTNIQVKLTFFFSQDLQCVLRAIQLKKIEYRKNEGLKEYLIQNSQLKLFNSFGIYRLLQQVTVVSKQPSFCVYWIVRSKCPFEY